jgi:hypothetical protein
LCNEAADQRTAVRARSPPSPLTANAGIDNERTHRSSRPLRSRISDGVCFLALCQLSQLGSQYVEGRLDLGGKSLTEDFPMLGLGRATMPRSAPFQLGDQFVVQIAYVQVPGHHGLYDLNDLYDENPGSNGAALPITKPDLPSL